MFPKKSIKSRYAIAQVNNNNYQTISIVGNKGNSALEAGYVWVPYIISSSPFGVVEESIKQTRKYRIQKIINNL
jgi:hypothetical protein